MTPHKIEELVEKLQRLAKFALEDCDCGICVQCRHAEAMDGAVQTIQALMRALEFYADQVGGCRKFGEAGDAARQTLDRDGGKVARQALSKESGK